MLAISPATRARLSAVKPERVRKLAQHRRVAVRDALAAMMRTAEPTQFALEAPCRYGLRVGLIMDGWSWGAADAEAESIVLAALAQAGARRPTWAQGQPEFCQPGVIPPPPRTTCARCGRPLDLLQRRFCSKVCKTAARNDRAMRDDREEMRAKEKAYRIAWSKRQPSRVCEVCGKSYQPKRASQKLCSDACRRDRARNLARRNMQMLCEAVHDGA